MRKHLLLVCLTASGLSAQDSRLARILQEDRAGREARLAGDWKTSRDHSRALDSLLGGYANARLAIARASLKLGDTASATRALDDVARMGLFVDVAADTVLRELAPRIQARFAANRRPEGTPRLIGAAPQADFLAEGVAWDAKGQRFLLSSIKYGSVVQAGADGRFRPFIDLVRHGGWAALGLAVDTARNRLWVTTNWYPHGAFAAVDSGLSAIHLYDLRTGALIRRFALPRGAHEPGDICLSRAGDLFVSDGREGTIRIIRHQADSLETFIGPGSLFSPQGCAVDDGRGKLFVADYVAGIMSVDIASKAVAPVAKPALSALSGIDGLTLFRDCLVGVQNGTNPNRVLGLDLTGDHSRIAAVNVLAQDTLVITNPTHVTTAGSDLVFVQNSGFANYDADGKLRQGAREEPSRIARIPGCLGTVEEGATSIQLPDTSHYSAALREIIRLERKRSAAIAAHDTAWLATLYAPDFASIAGNGRRITRGDLFAIFAQDAPSARFKIDELALTHVTDGVVRLTGRLTTFGPDGAAVGASRYTHIYVRRGTKWWISSAQATASPF